MKKYFLTVAIAAAAFCGAVAGNSDPVLMTIDGHDIRVSEFEYLYNKNNTQQVQPQTLDQYLNMFVDYKLKVVDAEHAGLDTTATFLEEIRGFRRDLAKPYMKDSELEERLIQEAYARHQNLVKVSHIMVLPEPGAEQRLDSIRTAILSGTTTFEEAAAAHSVDNASKNRGGLMGMVLPDRYPYPFVKEAYETPVGEISEVVNSGVGYHIIRVESVEPNPGQVLAEHILLMTRGKSPEETEAIRLRMDSIYNLAVGGADFGELARTYSQDPGSARSGGRLPWFGRGEMVAEFDSISFALPNGGICQPFASRFGYHIIHKVDSRGVASLDEMRPQILAAIGNDERANIPERAVAERVVAQKNAKLHTKNLGKVRKMIERNAGGYDSTIIRSLSALDMVVATFDGGEPVRLNQVMPTVPFTVATGAENAVNLISAAAYGILESAVLDSYRMDLARTEPEYRNLLNEYRDGILLFEISNKKVWEYATNDTEGLEAFFQANAERYAWPAPKFKSTIIFATNDSVLAAAMDYAATLSTADHAAFNSAMREQFGRDIKVERVIAAQGENPITDYLAFGGAKPEPDSRSRWTSYAAFQGRVISAPETAADVRGAAVTDYQAELDRRWVAELHQKYEVKINNDVFEALKARQ